MDEDSETIKEIDFNFIKYLKKDYWTIIILLVALLTSLYALYNVKAVEQRCNEHWIEEFKRNCPLPSSDIQSPTGEEIPRLNLDNDKEEANLKTTT